MFTKDMCPLVMIETNNDPKKSFSDSGQLPPQDII